MKLTFSPMLTLRMGLSLVVVLAASLLTAAGPKLEPELRIIPSPQSLTKDRGEFAFGESVPIALGDPNNTEDRFAADLLQTEIRKDLNIAATIGPPRPSRTQILIGVVGRDLPVDSALGALQLEVPKGLNDDQAYVLSIRPDRIVVAGRTSTGLFYGVQTLRQIIRANANGRYVPACTIRDWPALKYRGWQDDVSRGPIPTLAFLKKQVRICSEFKLNAFTLYTEHVFKLAKHPTIAPADGLSSSEIHELSRYCKQYHVELIGNFQSFGHFANILNVPGYGAMGESGWVLSPAKEESYSFLKDVYSEIAPSYDSPLFNINCDETGGLGEGASRKMVQQMGIAGVYAYHINRIAELLKPYGKTPMMWGDIALQHREIVPKLPKDLIVLSWGYHAGESFDDAIQPFTTLGFRFMVCPGVSCWSQIFPDLETAKVNISNYVRDGAKLGALGMLNTTWDDSGENLFENNWLPLAWGAECAWKPALPATGEDRDRLRDTRYELFCASFDPIFFGTPGDSINFALRRLSGLRNRPVTGYLVDQKMWTDLPTLASRPLPTAAESAATAREAQGIVEFLKSKPKMNQESVDNASFAARKAKFLADRAFCLALMANAAKDPWSKQESVKMLGRLSTDVTKLRDDYVKLWRNENHDWWLDKNVARYNRLIAELKSAGDTPLFIPISRAIPGNLYVQIGNLTGAPIRYTTDGSEPNAKSTLFVSPFNLTKTTRVRARAFPNGSPGTVVEATYFALRLPAKITTNMPVHEDDIPDRSFDNDITSYFWSSREARPGDWFQVTLDQPTIGQSIIVRTGHRDHPDDTLSPGVLEISPDGTNWEKVVEVKGPDVSASVFGKKIKAIRLRVTDNTRHWLLIREIELLEAEG